MAISGSQDQQSTIQKYEIEIKKLKRAEAEHKSRLYGVKVTAWLLGILLFLAFGFIGYLWYDKGQLFGAEGSQPSIVEVVDTVEVQVPAEAGSPWSKGVYFCVQIGAYKKVDLSLYSEKYTFFRYHLRDDLYKYTLGIFSTYEQAHAFRSELIRLGLKDAFVQAIRDGEPVDIREVIEK
ncbi:MAG: SPOR domain-containing protein [Cryomorphaceae bacterium]|nr:SPOR domain-containing protein [Cryomorphaceae bacterium]